MLETKYSGLQLDSILNYAWDMGICVIPLKDSGVFHGAAWNVNNRPVIILKQQVASHAKWIYDLLHELYHILVHLKDADEIILEPSEISPMGKEDDPKEHEANSFASQVIFNSMHDQFAQEAVALAKGKMELLKSAVCEVADRHNLRADSLANYLAHRLQYNGTNWWPTAESLQEKEPEPFLISKDILMSRIDIEKLGSIDYNILTTALNA